MPNYTLTLHENLAIDSNSTHIRSVTDQFMDPAADDESGWQRSIRAMGGFWYGESPYRGEPWELQEFFLTSLFRRILETAGGMTTWEGFIGEMELTLDGLTFVRSALSVANYVKTIYSRIGDNEFSNGSAESGVWDAVGTPSTREVTTSWFTEGTQGVHVVTDAADEGVEIQGSIAITSTRAYICRVSVEVTSGNWTLYVYKENTTDVVARRAISAGAGGKEVVRCYISEDNTTTPVDVQLLADGAGAEIYADGAVLQEAPFRNETKWHNDTDSSGEYGRIERVILEAGLTDAAADGLAQEYLTRHKWTRTRPPERFGVYPAEEKQADGLIVSCYGYVNTLNWRHLLTGGTDAANTQMSSLIGESEFITANKITTNATSVQVEESDPVGLWDAMEEILRVGDGSGVPWMGGVYADRLFDYEARGTEIEYLYIDGRLQSIHGGDVEPWFVRPGLCHIPSMPIEPTAISGLEQDNPRTVWLDEVRFIAPNGIELRREEDE